MFHSIGNKRGVTLLWTAVVALVLFAIGAFAVDLGNLWLVRNELQNTADSAALAAASALGSGDFKQVYARARAWAAENTADGEAVNLNFEDIAVGRWDEDTRTFTKYDPFAALPVGPDGEILVPNAVRVKASRDEEHTGPVKLAFGRLLGQDEAGLSAEAIAMGMPGIVNTPPAPDIEPDIENPTEPANPRRPARRLNPNGPIRNPDINSPPRIPPPDGFWEWSPEEKIAWIRVYDPYVIYVVDASDSMANYEGESKELAQALLHWSETAVVGKLITKVGLTSFENDVEIEQDLSPNVGAVYEGIDELRFGEVPEEKHSVAEALKMSVERLWNEPTGEMKVDKIAYLFSDGIFTEEEINQALAEAKKAQAGRNGEPIVIHTFGIGDEVNEAALKKIAEASGGDYYRCEDIMAAFKESMDNYMVWLVK